MGSFRNVSASRTGEASEVQVSGAIGNPDGTYGISLGDISSWPEYVDFITYARDEDGKVDENTRVVWTGRKADNSNVTASRVGGRESYVPDASNMATVVPTHCWANDITDALMACLPDDGENGFIGHDGKIYSVSTSNVQPSAVEGRTILWFKPLE